MEEPKLIEELNNVFSLQLPQTVGEEQLEQLLAENINHFISHDFNRLVTILYRIDVNEQKLKQILKENPDADAGLIIARMMIQRQREKIRTREEFNKNMKSSDEEKW